MNWFGFVTDDTYLAVVPYKGRYQWTVWRADRFNGRVFYGDMIQRASSLSFNMATSTGRHVACRNTLRRTRPSLTR